MQTMCREDTSFHFYKVNRTEILLDKKAHLAPEEPFHLKYLRSYSVEKKNEKRIQRGLDSD